MALKKCPRCELNYIQAEESYCNVCRRDIKGEVEAEETVTVCIECGENEPVKGSEYCSACLREVLRQEKLAEASDDEEEATLDIDGVELDDMDIPVSSDDDIPENELEEIENEFGDDMSDDEFDDEDDLLDN